MLDSPVHHDADPVDVGGQATLSFGDGKSAHGQSGTSHREPQERINLPGIRTGISRPI